MSSGVQHLPDFSDMQHHPVSEKIVEIISNRTQNDNKTFFRVMVAYYFSVMASSMRTNLNTPNRGVMPINLYAMTLSPSGTGKGFSTNIIENEIIEEFRETFQNETFQWSAEANIAKVACDRAARKGQTDPDEERTKVEREFSMLGPYLFSFDSGTSAAVKQMRQKLLLANAGSMNFHMDEIGSNLLGNVEVLNTYLELYDVGKVKQKLTKNTNDNIRSEEIHGSTPTNMLLIGTPSKLLNGGKQEEELYTMLETGYARRCFFAYAKKKKKEIVIDAAAVLQSMTDTSAQQYLVELNARFGALASFVNYNKQIQMSADVTLALIEYELLCKKKAQSIPEHDDIRKAEMEHRHFKAMKLAGAYAFIDEVPEVTMDHLCAAILLAEECGHEFDQLLTRDQPYVKLARYIADSQRQLTQAELIQDLPFFKGSQSQRNEMLQLAIAWGYQNNIIIKRAYSDGVEFYSGESLKPTELSKLIVSHSSDLVSGYQPDYAPFEHFHLLTQQNSYNWCHHHFNNMYRTEDNAITGFNLIVLDVENSVSIDIARNLLKDFTYHLYTTKSHTEENHRYRIVMPTNFILKLDSGDFKQFMKNVFSWLPFEVDTATGHRSRKWASWDYTYYNNEGQLFDVLPFIPKTSKSEEQRIKLESQAHMDNLERWVINNTGDGNRNRMLLRYALILLDAGRDFHQINQSVKDLNNKLSDRLEESEIMATIMVTVAQRLGNKQP